MRIEKKQLHAKLSTRRANACDISFQFKLIVAPFDLFLFSIETTMGTRLRRTMN